MTDTMISGRPIEGDINVRSRNRTEQKGAAEFIAALDRILDIPGVEAIKWRQYTPYFNDGDACEFGINEPYVKFVGQDDGGDYDDGFIDTSYDLARGFKNAMPTGLRYGSDEYRDAVKAHYAAENRTFETIKGIDVPAVYQAFQDLNWGAFENVAEDNFGDHATVTATKDGFNVEWYDHD